MLKADICLIFRGLFAVHRLYLIRIYLIQFYLILIHLIRHIDNLHDTFRLGERFDHTDPRDILPQQAHKLVNSSLQRIVHGDTFSGKIVRDKRRDRHHGDHHERQHRVECQCHENAADHQDRGADAKALHSTQHLLDIVGVCRESRDQGRLREFVRLRIGEPHDLHKQIAAYRLRRISCHLGCHAVCDHVEREREHRADKHHKSPHKNVIPPPLRDHCVDHIRQYPGQAQIHDRPDKLDDKPQQHTSVVRS